MDTSKLLRALLSSLLCSSFFIAAQAGAAPDLSIGKKQDDRQAKNGTSLGLPSKRSAQTEKSLGLKESGKQRESDRGSSKANQQRSSQEGPIATGGGMVQKAKDGKAKTLVEAGFVFERAKKLVEETQYQAFYLIKPETKEALKKLLAELPPINSSLFDDILAYGDRSVFIEQKEVNEKIYADIKKDYSAVVRSFRQKLDPSMLILAAYSTSQNTYILPAFDKELNPDQQAQILVHEYFMRKKIHSDEELNRQYYSSFLDASQKSAKSVERLKSVLEIDYMIYKFRNSAKTVEDQVEFYKKAKEAWVWEFTNSSFVESYFRKLNNAQLPKTIHQLESRMNQPLLLSDLFLHPANLQLVVPSISYPSRVTPGLIVRFKTLVPDIVEKLKDLNLGVQLIDHIGQMITDVKYDYKNGYQSQPVIDQFTYSDAPANQSEIIARSHAIADEQCALNSGYLAKAQSEMKFDYDALIHSDLELGYVLVIRCNVDNSGKHDVKPLWVN